MKKIKLFVLLSLLVLVPAILSGCSVAESNYKVANAYLTIDINPSIEIITGEDGLVTSVAPLNDDAELLLVDVNLVGLPIDEATNQIVALAIKLGYIDFNSENAIIITAEAGENTEDLKKTLSEKVNEFVSKRKMNIEVLKASFEATPEMKELATSLGISIGKLKLITVAMANDPELSLEAGAQMSVKDINRIIIDARKEIHEFYQFEFRLEYQQLKLELYLSYLKNKSNLFNEAIKLANIEKFAELDLTDEQITEVKALYQAYFDELNAIDISSQNDEENTESDNVVVDEIDELNKSKKTIREQLANELDNIKNSENFNKETLGMLQKKINNFRNELEEIDDQIEDILEESEDDEYKHRYERNYRHKNINKPYNPIKDLNKKYEQLFEEYGVDFEDIEEIFEDELNEQVTVLHDEYKLAVENLKKEFKTQSTVLKEQLKNHKRALKNIWRNK